MTSSPPSPASSISQPLPKKLPAGPVSFLSSQPARIYSVAHPLLLLSLLAIRFQRLVSDPVTELLNDLPVLAILQLSYVMICLPPAGSGPGSKPADSDEKKPSQGQLRAGKPGYRRRQAKSDVGGISMKLIPAILSLTLTALLATPALAILLVLFGAPLTTHNVHTMLCGAHMAVLSSTALIYVHGVDGNIWKEVWGVARPADGIWGGALGTAVGAWFGAVPIPLDWDRPWQAYPITILTGAYIGFAVGSLLGRSGWLYGKRIEFGPEELGLEPETEKKVD